MTGILKGIEVIISLEKYHHNKKKKKQNKYRYRYSWGEIFNQLGEVLLYGLADAEIPFLLW